MTRILRKNAPRSEKTEGVSVSKIRRVTINGICYIVSNEDEVFVEKKLLFAILERGIRDFISSNPNLNESAKKWMLECDPGYIFSFKNICSLLGFDAETLYNRLLTLRETALSNRRTSREIYRILDDLACESKK
jgi:hypothetical protein